jgi:excisionase family DNA binding protein
MSANAPLPPPEKLAYRVGDFCAASGISRSTFYDLVADGKLRPVKCGGRTLVPAEEARRFHHSLRSLGAAEAR